MNGLAALAVDDEAPALDELMYLLGQCPRVARAEGTGNAHDALERLRHERFDVVLADIKMPGLDGLQMVDALSTDERCPAVVFVTAHASYALDAFQVGAAGYLLKPLDSGRLTEVLARVENLRLDGVNPLDGMETLAAEHPGRTTIVHRSDVEWVEAAGDYVRLHTRGDESRHGYLVRIPIGLLEERWGTNGFVRIHRGHLVHLGAIRELRTEGSQTMVRVGHHDLPVSRRQVPELKDRLVGHVTRFRR